MVKTCNGHQAWADHPGVWSGLTFFFIAHSQENSLIHIASTHPSWGRCPRHLPQVPPLNNLSSTSHHFPVGNPQELQPCEMATSHFCARISWKPRVMCWWSLWLNCGLASNLLGFNSAQYQQWHHRQVSKAPVCTIPNWRHVRQSRSPSCFYSFQRVLWCKVECYSVKNKMSCVQKIAFKEHHCFSGFFYKEKCERGIWGGGGGFLYILRNRRWNLRPHTY